MTQEQLERLKKWFYEYVATFYGSDELVNDNIRLKEDHTCRMYDDTLLIAEGLGLDAGQKMLAETITLFHDVGRFEQFAKYRSYNDVTTENHSLLGLKVLADKKILEGLDGREKEIIETAIRLHGERELPGRLDSETELFAKLIRDIDKLDIYYVMISNIRDLQDNPEKCLAAFGCSPEGKCSEGVIKAVLGNRTIGYSEFKSLSDIILGMLGWVVDVNFVPVLKEMKRRGYFERLASFLPDTGDVREAVRHVNNLLKERIHGG